MKLVVAFILRWIVTSFGLWVAIRALGTPIGAADSEAEMKLVLVAGLILSLINIFIKPVVFIISLPATILTLGLFTLVINGLMVYLALQFTSGIELSFFNAVIAGIIIGVVNVVINQALSPLKAGT